MQKVVIHKAGGIGDLINGIPVVCGLKARYPADEIIYSVNPSLKEWALAFSGWDATIDWDWEPKGAEKFHMNMGYQIAYRLGGRGRSRIEYYCQFVDGVKPVLPTVKELPTPKFRDVVLIAPFSINGGREWTLPNFIELEDLLRKKGHHTVILGDRWDRLKFFKSQKLGGLQPLEVISVIQSCKCLIGIDSAPAHIAGILQKPAIALCGAFDGHKIFDWYGTVEVMNGKLSCNGCHQNPDFGFVDICSHVCASVNLITPQEVVEKFESMKCK